MRDDLVMITRRKPVAVAVLALGLVLAACGTADTEGATTTRAPEETTTTTGPTEAEPEGVSPGSSVEGEVELGQFPTPVSFATSDSWFVPLAQPGAVILEDLDQEAMFTRALLILSATPFEAETVDGWADGQDDVSILQQDEIQIGGFDTTVYDLTYDGPEEVPFLTAPGYGGEIVLRSTEYYRVWVIDIHDEAPLVLFSPVLRGDTGWFDKVQAIIDSMEFGEKK